MHVENIVYLVGRADALATSFYLLTQVLYQLHMGRELSLSAYAQFLGLTLLSGLCAWALLGL